MRLGVIAMLNILANSTGHSYGWGPANRRSQVSVGSVGSMAVPEVECLRPYLLQRSREGIHVGPQRMVELFVTGSTGDACVGFMEEL